MEKILKKALAHEQALNEQLRERVLVKWELPWSEEKILKTAVKRYGNTRQISKAAEECAELAAAISRFNANEGDYKEIISELADVEIMCRQLRMIYGDAEIDAARTEKLKRLEKRLKS